MYLSVCIKNSYMQELPYSDPEFAEAWEEWMAYKKETKKPYKTKRGPMMQLRWFLENKLTCQEAVFVIKESIRSEWLKVWLPNGFKNGTSSRTTIGDSIGATDQAFANLQRNIDQAMRPTGS
jgi:hypothetical protein